MDMLSLATIMLGIYFNANPIPLLPRNTRARVVYVKHRFPSSLPGYAAQYMLRHRGQKRTVNPKVS